MKDFDINKVKIAYTYLTRMADGRDPVTNHSVENEILDNPNVIRCLHYVCEILEEVKINNGLVGKKYSMPKEDFAYVAQTEREYIHQRQAEGIAAAKLKGKNLGRPPVRMPDGFEQACNSCMAGELSIRKAADSLGIKYSTFYRQYNIYKKSADSVLKGRISAL